MPELPEVETTKRYLSKILNNTKIINIQILTSKLRWKLKSNINKTFIHSSILKLNRIGKYIIIHCTNKKSLLIHLGMSGFLRIEDSSNKFKKHDHVVITILSKNKCVKKLILNDQRRFGYFDYEKSFSIKSHFLLKNLGLDGLSKKIDTKYLKSKLQNKISNIKNILLDQKIISGIGNIYASEILFRSKVNPLKEGRLLNDFEIEQIKKNIIVVLNEAIQNGGTTIRNYKQPSGKLGYFKQKLQVYGRDGLTCFNCKTKIVLLKINNRSSYLCPKCQT